METKSVQQIYTGLFKDRNSIEEVYKSICKKGYNVKNVNLIMSTNAHEKYFTVDIMKNKKPVGMDSPMSNINGINDIVKTGLVIPECSVYVAGPVSAGLSGAGTGGFSTGIIDSLLGIPDGHADKFESGLKDDHIIMSIQPNTEEDAAYLEKVWQENNVEMIYKK